jgi:hypothetical protein
MSDAPDYDSYLSSKVQHEIERLRVIRDELLAALEDVRQWDIRGRIPTEWPNVVASARAAIKKAKEQQPKKDTTGM